MNENMFQLVAHVSSLAHGKWTYYRAVIRLLYIRHGEWRGVNIAYSPAHRRSKRKAMQDIPPILLRREEYEREVARAIERVQTAPTEVFKVFALSRNGELRSTYVEQVLYQLGALYAHPIIPEYHVGLFVHPTYEDALAHAESILRKRGALAIARCAAAEMVNIDGKLATSALIPLEIERILLLSPIRLSPNGTVEEWDEERMRWRKTAREVDLSLPESTCVAGGRRYVLVAKCV